MKSSIFLLIIPAVQAGTNKTLAPTPPVGRPTPVPTFPGSSSEPTYILTTLAPQPDVPNPTAPPQTTPEPTYLFPTTPAPQPDVPKPTAPPLTMSMSLDYIVNSFGSSKSGKGSSHGSSSDDFINHFGSSGKSGKGSSSKSGKSSKSSSGKSGKGWRHFDGRDYNEYGYYHGLRRARN